ncbi:MAG: hypothetical protein ACOZQL_18085 [Myxococcota bacterium]
MRATGSRTEVLGVVSLACGLVPLLAVALIVFGLVFGIGVGLVLICLGLFFLGGAPALAFGLAAVLRARRTGEGFAVPGLGLGLGVLWLVLFVLGLSWYGGQARALGFG